MRRILSFHVPILFIFMTSSAFLHAQVTEVSIPASRDNTLYENPDGSLSNGSGRYLFIGRTDEIENSLRRALIAFDVAHQVPAGSRIVEVSLQLYMSRTITGDREAGLHRALQNWGEEDSDAQGQEGMGVVPLPGDATWIHTFFDTELWVSPGGDYAPEVSAVTTVGAESGKYTWTAPGMVDDVQSWLDDPASNFGWLILGDESERVTAKRFDTRESPLEGNRPVLIVRYEEATFSPIPALSDGFALLLASLLLAVTAWLLGKSPARA